MVNSHSPELTISSNQLSQSQRTRDDRARFLHRSSSRDSHGDRFEITSPTSSMRLDLLDLSNTAHPAGQSSTSTSPSTLDQLETSAQDPKKNQNNLDSLPVSAYRFPPSSVPPADLAAIDSPAKSASNLGLSLLNPSQTHDCFRLDLQSDTSRLADTIIPGASKKIDPQAYSTSDEATEDDTSSEPTKPHVPVPLKIFVPSYRHSISTPFTSTGLASLEFPARLGSITEDGTVPPSAQPDTSPNCMNPLQTPMPYGGADDSRESSTMKFPIDTSPSTQFAERDSPTPPYPPDQSTIITPASSLLNQKYRNWSGHFYVWVYDTLSSPPASIAQSNSSSSVTSILLNNRIGGISRHLFHHVRPGAEAKPTKSSTVKKERRGVKLGLISGLTKQRDTISCPQLELPAPANSGNSKSNLDPYNLSEQLDARADQSATDSTEMLQSSQSRLPDGLKTADQQTKPKKNHFSSDSRIGRKKVTPEPSGGAGTNESITSQLALGPGAAMNSQGVGSGQWKLVQGVITEDGHFTLYSGNDVILYRVYLPSYRRTDIRMVHQSIFGRPHCGMITRRTGSPAHSTNAHMAVSTLASSTSLPLHPSSSLFPSHTNGSLSSLTPSAFSDIPNPHQPGTAPSLVNAVSTKDTIKNSQTHPVNPTSQQNGSSSGAPELSIYICMPNSVLLESWLVICKCFCRPDDFRHLYPRSNKKNHAGGDKGTRARVNSLIAPQPNQEPSSSPALASTIGKSYVHSVKQGLPERVRIWRGVEIQLLEGRKLGETRQTTINHLSNDHSSGVMARANSGTKSMAKEERRNSTGGFLRSGSQSSLPSISKESLFNKSNVGKHPDLAHQSEQQNAKQKLSQRYHQKNLDESEHPTPGFASSITTNLKCNNQPNNQLNRQSLQCSSLSNFEDQSASTSLINTSIPTNESSTTHSSKHNSISMNSFNDCFYFVEFDWDKEIVGRSTIKRNANPFWSASFKLSEIGSFKTPLILNLYQIKRSLHHSHSKSSSNPSHSNSNSGSSSVSNSSKITLIGQSHLDFKTLEKNSQLQLWLPIYSNDNNSAMEAGGDENLNLYDGREYNGCKKLEIMGEINLSITVIEQVVLAEAEYAKMMNALNNDDDIELALNLAHMAVGELDRLAELLIRIYEANNRLILRFSQLAAIEINGDLSTASILFRANTLLTKMLEAYMRIVGRSFLESSIGSVIRRICMAKIELEIDPAKLKHSLSSNQKEKIVNENAKELKKISNEIWQSMYINRSKCPNRLRKIFVKIQELVGDAYDDQDMRLTSISAFIFLRFFVPAILNPRLFNLIQFQPDSKSQRTLTLVAKTLQGLGNLTLFGIKEPWMSVMNEFITTQLDSFRDYISYIASESDSSKPEWTSKEYEGYGLPYALRASLPASSRDGIPILPHLLDPVRDCSLLASLMTIINRRSSGSDPSKHHSSVLPPKPTSQPRRYTELTEPLKKSSLDTPNTTAEFLKICGDLHAKSERRYLKIIQSESKDLIPSTKTTPATTFSAPSNNQNSSTDLPPPSTLTQPGSPHSNINSRKWNVNSIDQIGQSNF